mgnify:CR=1 FL=1
MSGLIDIEYDAFAGTAWLESKPDGLVYAGNNLYTYKGTAPREAEHIATQFIAKGFSAYILRYSCDNAKFPCALTELSWLLKHIRENAEENNNPSDELLRLLDESEDLRGDSVSSQRSKEIYNKGDTSQNKKINTDDVFVF